MKTSIFVYFCFFCLYSLSAQTSFNHNGINRTYEIFEPSTYTGSTPIPLVFALHGNGGNASNFVDHTGFNTLGESEGFIVIYPNALISSGYTQWNYKYGSSSLGIDDVGFVIALKNEIIANFNIDTTKIFICGFSGGAFLTNRIACEEPLSFSSYGMIGSFITSDMEDVCTSMESISIAHIHGNNDTSVPFNPGVTQSIDFWLNKNNCNLSPIIEDLPNTDTSDGTTTELKKYNTCDNNKNVWLYEIDGGNHVWPGREFSSNSVDFKGSEELWRFFNNIPNLDLPDLSSSTVKILFNNNNKCLHIQSSLMLGTLNIYDVLGNLVHSCLVEQRVNQLDFLNKGFYIVNIEDQNLKIEIQ